MFGFVCLLVCFGRLTVLLGLFSKKLPRIIHRGEKRRSEVHGCHEFWICSKCSGFEVLGFYRGIKDRVYSRNGKFPWVGLFRLSISRVKKNPDWENTVIHNRPANPLLGLRAIPTANPSHDHPNVNFQPNIP